MHPELSKHIVLVLIRHKSNAGVAFLFQRLNKWQTPEGKPFFVLPSKATEDDDPEPFEHDNSLEAFIDTGDAGAALCAGRGFKYWRRSGAGGTGNTPTIHRRDDATHHQSRGLLD
jgi:hypothetical protein